MLDPYIQIKTRAGDPISAAGNKIVPVSRALIIQLPGLHGGFVWNRPVAVAVRTSDGQEKLLPVRDMTRLVQIGILAFGFTAGLLIWLGYRKNSKNSMEETNG